MQNRKPRIREERDGHQLSVPYRSNTGDRGKVKRS